MFRCQDTQVRKVAEGALISLNSTFSNNKGATHESKFINFNVCKSLRIKNFSNIGATLSSAALPLSSQVNELVLRAPHDTGAYAAPQRRPLRPDPPDAVQPRRSQRLQQRRIQNQ